MPMTQAVLTAIGPDRPGRVEDLSRFIFEHGGNIETSRMLNLGGHFAMMVIVGGSDDAIAAIERHLPAFADGAQLACRILPVLADAATRGNWKLISRGKDRAGALHQVSHLLRSLAVNIEGVNSRVTPGGETAAGEFELEMLLTVPTHVPVSKLREYVGHLWSDQPIAWELVEASPSAAPASAPPPAGAAGPA